MKRTLSDGRTVELVHQRHMVAQYVVIFRGGDRPRAYEFTQRAQAERLYWGN
jgi:hypothetical protein